jgi:hypothetical protein
MANLPSIKTLATIFADNAKKARAILEMDKNELLDLPENDHFVRSSYNTPSHDALILNALNELGDFHGVEAISNDDGEYLEYLNAGDTYAGTLIYWRGNYRVTTIGDMVENRRNKFNQ